MTEHELEQLRYPIGRFMLPETITTSLLEEWIGVLETFPERLEALVAIITAMLGLNGRSPRISLLLKHMKKRTGPN